MLRRWVSIVRGLRNSVAATSFEVTPTATLPAISRSWAVSRSRGLVPSWRGRCPVAASSRPAGFRAGRVVGARADERMAEAQPETEAEQPLVLRGRQLGRVQPEPVRRAPHQSEVADRFRRGELHRRPGRAGQRSHPAGELLLQHVRHVRPRPSIHSGRKARRSGTRTPAAPPGSRRPRPAPVRAPRRPAPRARPSAPVTARPRRRGPAAAGAADRPTRVPGPARRAPSRSARSRCAVRGNPAPRVSPCRSTGRRPPHSTPAGSG
ncbi:hypothetical protein SAMN04489732_107276 [Amycolatopsis saalfeldensis]|uniref:Uncharacterized protein n=1 Tax=Amycolatopsis saalfeldensis TaxID=394193 RepID=A0A1H8XHU0_9PSEU|nr:hypothetical protein SAMN04489732_107276 [Amycolatopsis saalfeldensis]